MQNKRKKSVGEGKRVPLTLTGGFHLEADKIARGVSVSVAGVISVLDFTDEVAVLRVREGRVKISGSALEITVYESKTVEIKGRVSGVELLW